jgi:hypothetical protein
MKKTLFILFLLFFSIFSNGQIKRANPFYVHVISTGSGGGSTLLENILAYWKLDEASGNAIDQPGSADLTVTGATQHVAGKLGYAVSFDGTNDFLGSIDATFELQTFSVAAWVKTTQTGETSGIIDNYRWGGYGWSVEIGGEWDNDGLAVFHLNNADVNELNLYKYPGGTSIRNGNWHLIIATFNGSTANLYVDNTLEATSAWAHTIVYHAENILTLGSRNGYELFFAGTIDEAGIWTKVLSSDERTTLWNSGTGITYPFE